MSSPTLTCTLLDDLRSVNRSCFFAELYYQTTKSINNQLQSQDEVTSRLTLRFQNKFADYFLQPSNSSEWQAYYTDRLYPLQYRLLGINAHINGDMWQALIECFDQNELELYAEKLLAFQLAISQVYTHYYELAIKENATFRKIHFYTCGLSKKAGLYYLCYCRLQQVKLALLYYKDRKRFNRKLNRLKAKKKWLDQCILSIF